MKITSEIYQVGGSGFSGGEDAAVYLVCFGEHAAVIDAGCGYSTETIIKNIYSCGVKPEQVKYLFLTHCHFDHTGGADLLSGAFQCKIVAHELDATYLESGDNGVTAASWYGASIQPFHVDVKISGSGKEFCLGEGIIRAIHTPGHSPGSMVFLTESEGQKVLFGQDIHGPLDPALLSNRKDYVISLKRISGFKADILCEGHYGIYRGREEVKQFIDSYISNN